MRHRSILLLMNLAALVSCQSEEEKRIEAAQQYVDSRPDISPEVKQAILEGRVLIGMYPDEAYHAAGAFVYELRDAPAGVFPPDVIFSQRQNPSDKIVITLRFSNRTQFGSDETVAFKVVFRNGRAAEIVK